MKKKLLVLVTVFAVVLCLSMAAFAAWVNPYKDVTEGDWFYDGVAYVTEEKLMTGVSGDTFGPLNDAVCSELYLVLARMDGVETDLPQSAAQWAARWRFWIDVELDGSLTREQVVYVLWRYELSPKAVGTLDAFSDAGEVSPDKVDAMTWAVSVGLINGTGDGLLAPGSVASRGELAAIVSRFSQDIATDWSYRSTLPFIGGDEGDNASVPPSSSASASMHMDPNCSLPVCTDPAHYEPYAPPAP